MDFRTVLILADEKDDLLNLKKAIEGQFFILFTTSPKEAVHFIIQNPELVSAVCISYDLKKSKNENSVKRPYIEFLNELHSNKKTFQIPTIVVAKKHSEQAEHEALENGAADFIYEPYDEQLILKRLGNLIDLNEAAATAKTITHDELTGLYTKKHFLMRSAKILESKSDKAYDFVCIEVERLKLATEISGADIAEKISKQLGKKVISEAKLHNGIAGKFSENLFFIMIERPVRYSEQNLIVISNSINAFPQTTEFNIRVRFLFGVYQIPNMRLPIPIMCERAQMAMEKLKTQHGKILCIYDNSLLVEKEQDQKIASSMESALKNNEFLVYYQPKYNLKNNNIFGAEALVRWQNPELGFMQPAKFIPLFEKKGFITSLDIFICEKVCQDLYEWVSAGNEPIAVSVNLFRADLFNYNFVMNLVDIVQKYKIAPKYFHLEISESDYSEYPEQVGRIIYELRKNEFVVELSNFGAGDSSLNVLSEVPVDFLKLDMDFVRNELEFSSGKGILYYVINLTKQLGISVIAEGVETVDQVERLKDFDCDYAQGFYFSKPLSKENFFKVLKETVSVDSIDSVREEKAKGGTMLIVDDFETSRIVISKIFKNEYNVAFASSGEEAWNYIQKNHTKISIVILDLMMPGMSGFDVLKLIRENENTKTLPVLVTTSQDDTETEMTALEMNADDFMSKPFNAKIMRHRVQNVVAHSLVQKLEQEQTLTKRILEIERQARSDFLTGLNNRTVLEKTVGEFFTKSETYDAVFISLDVDDFKTINDTYGHLAGDDTIKRVANILVDFFGKKNCVCRMGGDEFAVFIPKRYSNDALEKMLKELCTALRFEVETLKISCSIGVATAPDFGMDYQTLYNNSDMALLAAKRFGKNQFNVFSGKSVLPSYVFYRNMDWLLDEFSDAVFVCYAETYDLIYLNRLACHYAGKEKKDCIGKKCYEVFYNKKKPCEFCIDKNEIRHDFVQKNIFPNENDKNLCYNMRAKVVNWNGNAARIQYLKKRTIDKELIHSLEDMDKNVAREFNNLPCGVCKLEPESPFRIVIKNKALHKILGYGEIEFKNKFNVRFENIIYEEDRARIVEELNKNISASETFTLNFRVKASDKTLKKITAFACVVSKNEKKYIYLNLFCSD